MRKFVIGMILFFAMLISLDYAYGQTPLQPVTDSEKYIIGPEDVLNIGVWKEEALSKTVSVRTDGKISLPLIDEIQAAGVTPLGLKDILTNRFKEFLESPIVNVTVMETNSYKIYLLGAVKNPGVVKIRSETTLAQVISMAGGFTDLSTDKKIVVLRKENDQQKSITVNYNTNKLDSDSEKLKNTLMELEAKYTSLHPDVISAKKKITDAEQKNKQNQVDGQDWSKPLLLKAGDTILVQ